MIDINEIDFNVSFNSIFEKFEEETHIKNKEKNEDYFNRFLLYLKTNRCEKFKLFFKNDNVFEEFIKINFLKLPIKIFYKSFQSKIDKMIKKDLAFFHNNPKILCILLEFYDMPKDIIKLYPTIFPEYFDEKFEYYEKLMSVLFKFHKVPLNIFYDNLNNIKKHKEIVKNIICSDEYSFYYNNIFEKNRKLFIEFHNIMAS